MSLFNDAIGSKKLEHTTVRKELDWSHFSSFTASGSVRVGKVHTSWTFQVTFKLLSIFRRFYTAFSNRCFSLDDRQQCAGQNILSATSRQKCIATLARDFSRLTGEHILLWTYFYNHTRYRSFYVELAF